MIQAAAWTPYCGAAPSPGELLTRWNLDPFVLVALAALALAWRPWNPRAERTEAERRRLLAAVAVLAVLFISPFCALTSALFSARVVHHVVLTAVAAPLLASFLPVSRGGLALWTALHGVVFWLWHAPMAYAWALSNDAAYWLMQASLLLSAMALWRQVLRAPVTSGVAALLATMVHMGLLGALLTFSGSPFYAPHLLAPHAWGLTPLEDQQLAGLIMWVPGAGLYLAAAVSLLARWFEEERRAGSAA